MQLDYRIINLLEYYKDYPINCQEFILFSFLIISSKALEINPIAAYQKNLSI